MRYVYPCTITPDEYDLGAFTAQFPDVPGATTGTWGLAETLVLAEDALLTMLGSYYLHGEPLPVPSPIKEGQYPVPLDPIAAAKVAIHHAMQEQGITRGELGRRLDLDDAALYRLLDPDRRSHFGPVERALRALGRALVVEDVEAPEAAELEVPASAANHRMSEETYAPWDIVEVLTDEETIIEYLRAALEESDPEFFVRAVGDAARAMGMTSIAQQTQMGLLK